VVYYVAVIATTSQGGVLEDSEEGEARLLPWDTHIHQKIRANNPVAKTCEMLPLSPLSLSPPPFLPLRQEGKNYLRDPDFLPSESPCRKRRKMPF
jgi:hypothetical protein